MAVGGEADKFEGGDARVVVGSLVVVLRVVCSSVLFPAWTTSGNPSWSLCLYIHCGVRNHSAPVEGWEDTAPNGCSTSCIIVMSTKRTAAVPPTTLTRFCIMLLTARTHISPSQTNVIESRKIVRILAMRLGPQSCKYPMHMDFWFDPFAKG